jgi:3-dehydroquinate synthase
MQTVNIDLADRSYAVYIGSGILGQDHPAFASTRGSTALIVSNETVAPLYLESLTHAMGEADVNSRILPDGE